MNDKTQKPARRTMTAVRRLKIVKESVVLTGVAGTDTVDELVERLRDQAIAEIER